MIYSLKIYCLKRVRDLYRFSLGNVREPEIQTGDWEGLVISLLENRKIKEEIIFDVSEDYYKGPLWAIIYGFPDFATQLWQDYANPEYLLFFATSRGYIIDLGINEEFYWSYGLYGASYGGYINIFIKINNEKKLHFNAAFLCSFYAILGCRLEMIKYLRKKYHVELYPGFLETAARLGCYELVEWLIPRIPNCNINMGLIGASRGGHLDLVKYLISKGANNFSECMEIAQDNVANFLSLQNRFK